MLIIMAMLAGLLAEPVFAVQSSLPTISQKTKGMKKFPGFFTFYWDETEGKIWLEIEKWNEEFLYANSLPAGLGSNDIGLDRGQLGGRRIVKFQKTGPKILLVQPNYDYRAISNNEDEKRAVEEAFAQSVLWGFKLAASEEGRGLVDATDFYIQDVHNVIQRLKNADQGSFKLDASRSAFYLPSTKNFPNNTEVEVTLTFTGDSPGGWVRSVAPTGQSVTVRQRHSFIRLPDNGYEPREFDSRAGFYGIGYMDYATPIESSIQKRFISRHRLKKKNPEAAMSEPVKPIIYYLDRGAPEPIRSALLEGARWWNQAFEAAGYRNAFRVELMPEDADPMDVRYNMINWVHRSTRGWSYGSSITDPRTGEIIKGHISLGSLRVRQDFLIATGLLAPYKDGSDNTSKMKEMALARLRQLSAHEVGHTLGLSHNFAASVSDRASVMDYPHPFIKLGPDGQIDISEAYATDIGDWDKVAIKYGYQDFPRGTDIRKQLDDILTGAIRDGLQFISDSDARPDGGAHPSAHLWDNGTNPADELMRVLKIRSVALGNFSESNIRQADPMATLEEVLVPIYLFHRYQLQAAAKMLGGLYYTYALRGDGQKITEIVSPQEQGKALDALIETLRPNTLTLPERILRAIPPRSFGFGRHRELFDTRTSPAFDPLSAAEAASNVTVSMILNANRAGRLVEYHARDSKYPGFVEILDRLLDETWQSQHLSGLQGEVQRVVDSVTLHGLMTLVANDRASQQVRSIAFAKLGELKDWLVKEGTLISEARQKAHMQYAAAQIELFQKNPETVSLPEPQSPPPGSPIGMACGQEKLATF